MKVFLSLIFVLSLTGVSLAETRLAAKSTDYDVLASVDKLTTLEQGNYQIKVFETSGGDPALNGNVILLSVSDTDPDGYSYIWETGIDMGDINSIKLQAPSSILIEGSEDFLEDAEAKQRPVVFKVTYGQEKGVLSKSINVERVK